MKPDDSFAQAVADANKRHGAGGWAFQVVPPSDGMSAFLALHQLMRIIAEAVSERQEFKVAIKKGKRKINPGFSDIETREGLEFRLTVKPAA